MVDFSRRDFLKFTGGVAVAGAVAVTGNQSEAQISVGNRLKDAKVTTTICPYCSVGCSILVYAKDGKVINMEGDTESPINEGALCPKGASLYELANNPYRVKTPLYRAPGATEWKEVQWEWALDQIARRVKAARDKTFKHISKVKVKEKDTDGKEVVVEKEFVVNRTDAIAHIGSAALDNEECYLIQKLMRSWGLVWIEHQARI